MQEHAALEKAVELAGGQAELARKLSDVMDRKILQQHVWNWLNRDSQLPAEYVIPVEKAVDGKVSRHDLRSDLYPREHHAGAARPAA